jgi:hypothetical protein
VQDRQPGGYAEVGCRRAAIVIKSRVMRKLTLLSLAGVMALSAAACEDDTKAPPRDGAVERLDASSDARDTGPSDSSSVDLRDMAPGPDMTGVDQTTTVDMRDVAPPVDLRDAAVETPPTPDAPDAGVDVPDAADVAADVPADTGTDAGTDLGNDTGTDGGSDAGSDGGTDAGNDAGTDAIPSAKLINGCTPVDSYIDRTADGASRVLTWAIGIASNPAKCMKVRVGQMVVMSGDFAAHPLVPDEGDVPTPIASKNSGTDLIIMPTIPGTFGYVSSNEATMTGAFYVVP